MPTKKVLVTGSAGAVGRACCRALTERGYHVRGFDRLPNPALNDQVLADLLSIETVREAMRDVETVVHLAATPTEADFLSQLLPNNVTGLYHVFEAARLANVRRIIVASSVQAVGALPWKQRLIRLSDGVASHSMYSATKVFAESVGQVYAHRRGMTVIAARLGWLPRSIEDTDWAKDSPQGQSIYLSHDDAGRFFVCAVEAPDQQITPGFPEMTKGRFAAMFVTSVPVDEARFDLEPAQRVVGYQPRDAYPHGLRWA